MSKLIEEINLCLLALFHGDTVKYKTFDIFLLQDQFEASGEYTSSKYNPLRNALDDLLTDNREKLKCYESQMIFTRDSKNSHTVIQDIYDWAGIDRRAYFERYINLLENGSIINHSTESNNQILKVDPSADNEIKSLLQSKSDHKPGEHYFVNDKLIDEIKDFWESNKKIKATEHKPWVFASLVYYMFKFGFFIKEKSEKEICADRKFCYWLIRDNKLYESMGLKESPQIKNYFEKMKDVLIKEGGKPHIEYKDEIIKFTQMIQRRYNTVQRDTEKDKEKKMSLIKEG